MRYVLIIQFPQSYFTSHDDLVAFEDRLIATMPRTCAVDGHDIGSGTTNFFIFTDAPLAAHKRFRKYFHTRAMERNLRVAYREVDGEAYMNLWPFRDPRPFAIIYPEGEDPFSPASKRAIPKRSPPGVLKFVTPAGTSTTNTRTARKRAAKKRTAKKRTAKKRTAKKRTAKKRRLKTGA